ncbi:MAG: SET domain-containing protein-lysine N-methyltransferase [Gammaproteobacteria bacterium]|nr:SET domain-containing protein-lysine N-methyltransferase [Gammaproteobacteria bacterium]
MLPPQIEACAKIQKVRIEIKPSKFLEGEVGVFACRKIEKDEIVVHFQQFKSTFFSWDSFAALDSITKRKVYGYCSGDKDGFYAPPDLNYISTAWYLNHSCAPNIGFDAKFNFVAMRNISRGEELCWDYAYDETNSLFKMKCSCGANHCRNTVRGDDWTFLVKNRKIFKYLSPTIKKFGQLQSTHQG